MSITGSLGGLVSKAQRLAEAVRVAETQRAKLITHLRKVETELTSSLEGLREIKNEYARQEKEALEEGYEEDFSESLLMIEQVSSIYAGLLETTIELLQ